MVYKYIWQDTYYTTDDYDVLDYYIEVDDERIYRGRAYRCPGDDVLIIKINDICENYLNNNLPIDWPLDMEELDEETYAVADSCKTFGLHAAADDELLEEYTFVYNWSYEEYDPAAGTTNLSRPINGHYADGMYVFWSEWRGNPNQNGLINTRVSIPESGRGYTVKTCGQGALYYLNSHGGYDALLIEGNIKRTDKLTSLDITKNYNNKTIGHGKDKYMVTTVPSWSLNTSWLTDEQARNLAVNLIPSVKVYFHDFNDGKIYPVTITDNSAEHKMFRNGRRLVNYTINIEDSQNLIRK